MVEFFIGIAASLTATLLYPTFLENLIAFLVRFLGISFARKKMNLAGSYISTWEVTSKRYEESSTDKYAYIIQLGNRIYMHLDAEGISYIANGIIDEGRYVTGVWHDETVGGYHGAFQLVIDPVTKNMSGEWIGYSTEGIIKHGKWIWDKQIIQNT